VFQDVVICSGGDLRPVGIVHGWGVKCSGESLELAVREWHPGSVNRAMDKMYAVFCSRHHSGAVVFADVSRSVAGCCGSCFVVEDRLGV